MAEDQERQNRRLGELSDLLLRERGEEFRRVNDLPQLRAPDVKNPFFPGLLNSPLGGAGESGQQSPGSSQEQMRVSSVYNIRPINARDFFLPAILNNTGTEVYGAVDFPNGFIGVLREISVQMFNTTAPDRIYISPVDGVAHPQFVVGVSQMPDIFQLRDEVLSALSGTINTESGIIYDQLYRHPVHMIVPEDGTLYFGMSNIPASVGMVRFELYGNLLASRGLPPNFEIGSK